MRTGRVNPQFGFIENAPQPLVTDAARPLCAFTQNQTIHLPCAVYAMMRRGRALVFPLGVHWASRLLLEELLLVVLLSELVLLLVLLLLVKVELILMVLLF